ncbi:hypothetical protein Salat_2689800 [Sesamum alatum]|uniref:Uncharacterized protein n=1 Tax=Sesamum alatum TaxID=300844 RepID=A0AAE1XPS9_9LAMI|nr:hypothetical protein Salat_2689800 [Sesamum alatum]
MDARIANRLRTLMGALLAGVTRNSSEAETSVAPFGEDPKLISLTILLAPTLRLHRHLRSQPRKLVARAEEDENSKLLKKLALWWKEGVEELKFPSCRAATFGDHQSLKCSMWRHEKTLAEVKNPDLKSLADSEHSEKELLKSKAAVEAKIVDLEAQLQRPATEVEKSSVITLDQGKTEGFSASRTASSAEGARDFLKAPAFKVVVEVKASEFANGCFEICRLHVAKLKGFIEAFDQSRLDPCS